MAAVGPKAAWTSGTKAEGSRQYLRKRTSFRRPSQCRHGDPRDRRTRKRTMEKDQTTASSTRQRTPWNKGKLIGTKPPLRPKEVWSIRTKLHIEGRILE